MESAEVAERNTDWFKCLQHTPALGDAISDLESCITVCTDTMMIVTKSAITIYDLDCTIVIHAMIRYTIMMYTVARYAIAMSTMTMCTIMICNHNLRP